MTRVEPDLVEQSYAYCRELTKREAKNFYYGFVMLPTEKRNAIYAAYAFARLADDTVDEEGETQRKATALEDLRVRLRRGLEGSPDSPLLTALADAVELFSIPHDHFFALLDGCATDLDTTRYQTWDEARLYCQSVASTVALISLEIFGYKHPDARQRASDLGLALQLTNILRDIKEDAERGRIYIPLDDIAAAGYSEERLLAGVVDDAFRRLMAQQVARARLLYKSGRELLPLLDSRSRACCGVMEAIYSRILDAIEDNDYDVFSRRISISSPAKLALMAKAWLLARLP